MRRCSCVTWSGSAVERSQNDSVERLPRFPRELSLCARAVWIFPNLALQIGQTIESSRHWLALRISTVPDPGGGAPRPLQTDLLGIPRGAVGISALPVGPVERQAPHDDRAQHPPQ